MSAAEERILSVFYSWQSDLQPSLNRRLIQTSLEKAIKALNRDEATLEQAARDELMMRNDGQPANFEGCEIASFLSALYAKPGKSRH